ncbi:MAG: ABC transporter substrate-binding protein, partial [Geobacteraceae bacterium]|nr:ABC transporter substrate-binding protein [Geobacteraceae bacterium]
LKEAEKIIEKRTGIAARVPELLPARQFIVSERDITRWIDIVTRNGSIKPGEVKPIDVFTNEFNPYASN